MKTAIQELIERLEDKLIDAKYITDNPKGFDERDVQECHKQIRYTQFCIHEATELFEKERKQIERAHANGIHDASACINGEKFKTSEQYYNETFKQ